RDRASHNGGIELEGLLSVGVHGLEVHLTMSVLTASAGLSCVLAVHINRLGEGLLVGNLGSAHVCLYVELAEQTVHDDLQVKLTHTGDDGLTGLLIGSGAEGRILLCQLRESLA